MKRCFIFSGLITSTVHSTRRHACEIYNNLKLLRLSLIEIDRPFFNSNLEQFISNCQSSKRSTLSSSKNHSQSVYFRREDTNHHMLTELQHLLNQNDIKLFKICYIHSNRFTVMKYCSLDQKEDSCLLFTLGGKLCIGFIQNIVQVHRNQLLLRVHQVKIRDQLHLNFNNNKFACPNIFYGNVDMDDTSVFIRAQAIVEKIVFMYHKKLRCYIFSRVPNLCESS